MKELSNIEEFTLFSRRIKKKYTKLENTYTY